MEILNVLIRTIIFYFIILVSFRLMGKREVGQLQVSDLTISILIAELVAISIENRDEGMYLTFIPIIMLTILEIISSLYELKVKKLRDITNGKPSIIILDGKLNMNEMVKQRYSIEDLLLSLRAKEIKNIKDVSYAILETNGKLSIFKKGDNSLPLPIIVSGEADKEVLSILNKSETWLKKVLYNNNLRVSDIMYGYLDNNSLYIIRK